VDQVPVVPGQVPAGVATVLQGHGLVSLLTAAENIEIALFAAGVPPAQAAAAAQEALASLGLDEHAGQLADELSGGQQQRVAVARALATQPAVLIADEPTAEQDSASRELVLSQMLGLAETGKSLVLATHDPEVAQRCDRVVNLADLRPDSVGPSTLATG
jgi:putative ABC transport system ATP-binding protein